MSVGLFTHSLEEKRLAAVSPYIQGKIIDIGCGYASYLRRFQPAPGDYVGIEKNKEIIDWLCSRYPLHVFIHCDVDLDRLPDLEQVGCIICLAVLEHLDRPDRLFSEVHRILPPGKPFILTTPTPFGGYLHGAGSRIGLFSSEARHDHRGFYSQKDLVKMLEGHQFTILTSQRFLVGLNQLMVCTRE